MVEKENTDELVVVDAKRYSKVKKALVESLAGDKNAVPPSIDEKESTRELVVVDVKRYKRVKKALEASEQRYRQLFENVPIGIYRTTPDGRIIDSNPALVAMLGYDSFAELATRNLEKDPRHPVYSRADFIKRLERDGEIRGLESVWTKKDGSLLHIRENAKLVRSDDGQVFYEGTVEDITQSKRAEEAQRVRTQQVEILNCIITKGNLAESLSDMMEVILDCMFEPLGFDNAGIFMYDPTAKKVNLLARRGKPTRFALDEKYMSIDNMPFSQVLSKGLPAFLDDTQKNHPYFFKKWGWRMACSVPLVSKGRVIGALNAASCRRTAFSPEEKDILEMIGKEAGTLVSKLQTETALRESEKYYRTLIDTSPDIIVVMDLEARLITVNQQFLKVGGYFYDEVIGASTYDFVEGLDPDLLGKRTVKFIKNRKMSGSEYRFKKKDGRAVPLEVSAGLLNDDAGRPMGIIAIGRDITQRKRADEALRESEGKFRSISEQTSDLIAITDADGIITYASASARSLFQLTPEEMQGRKFMDFLDAPSVSKALAAFRADLEHGGRTVGLELTMKRMDGSLFAGELNGSSFQYGAQYGSLVVIRDVSERKQKEEALRHSEDTFRRTFEAIPDPAYIWTRQADGRITLSKFNQAAMRITQDRIKDFEGIEAEKLFAAQPGFVKKIVLAMDKGNRQFDEVLYAYQSTGTSKWLQVDYVRTAEDNVLVITKDVSERKEAEAKLLAYQEQLRTLTSELFLIEEKERRRIASELHDQIGQNLALCKLKVAALEKDMTSSQVKSELSAVRRLLECSIQDTRSLIFDLSPPVLYELGLQAALEWLAERIEEQYHVPVEFENRAGDGVLGNDLQVILFQVVRELLVNMGKHSRASQAKVILSRENHFLKIQVNDDGVGFDASQIYDAKGHPGSYGFFSMRERLNYLGGGLEVRSKSGQGSQIVLTVPQEAAAKGEKQ
jgi:PAS domain S-box-containing protein